MISRPTHRLLAVLLACASPVAAQNAQVGRGAVVTPGAGVVGSAVGAATLVQQNPAGSSLLLGPALTPQVQVSVTPSAQVLADGSLTPLAGARQGVAPSRLAERASTLRSPTAERRALAETVLPGRPVNPAAQPRERAGAAAEETPTGTLMRFQTPDADATVIYDGSRGFRRESTVQGVGAAEDPRAQARRAEQLSPAKTAPSGAVRGEQPPAPEAPRSSFSRSFKFGYVSAWLMLAYNIGVPAVAEALGYQFHPSYEAPPLVAETAAAAAALMLIGSFMAPVAEEAIFRGGLMRWMQKRLAGFKTQWAAFWLPAIGSSLLFAVLHEHSDPVVFGVYMGLTMALSRIYYKEGILAAMVAHGVFDVVLFGLMLAPVFALQAWVGGALFLAGAPVFFWAARSLWKERGDRASGAVKPLAMTPGLAKILGYGLMAGTALVGLLANWELALGGGVLWVPAAFGMLWWAGKQGGISKTTQ